MLVVGAAALTGHVATSIVLILAVVAGLPHGATDAVVGRHVFRFFGSTWWLPFLAAYVGLAALVLGMWAALPTFMLATFLVLSVIHFGMQDGESKRASGSWFDVVAHGGAPIVVPALFHTVEVERLFTILAGQGGSTVLWLIAGPAVGIWVIAVAVVVYRASETGKPIASLLDLGLTSTLFAVAPPLVAFSFYFALLHTPRAFVSQHRRGSLPAMRQSLSLTAMACFLGFCIYYAGQKIDFDANVVRTSFMLLSALTVPHMALEYGARKLPTRTAISYERS